MLEAYKGFYEQFDTSWGSRSRGITGSMLKYKTLEPPKGRATKDAFSGADLWRRYKDLRAYYFNIFMPAFGQCLNTFGATTASNIPSGKTIDDVLLSTLQLLWEAKERDRLARASRNGEACSCSAAACAAGGSGDGEACSSSAAARAAGGSGDDEACSSSAAVRAAGGSGDGEACSSSAAARAAGGSGDGEACSPAPRVLLAGGTMLRPMPGDWLPFQFMAIAMYGEPSLDPSAHLMLSAGVHTPVKKKRRNNPHGVVVTTDTLDDALGHTTPVSNSRSAQRSEAANRQVVLQKRQVITRNKERARRRLIPGDVVSDDEPVPTTAEDDAAQRHAVARESIVRTGESIARSLHEDSQRERMRDVVASAKALYELDPTCEQFKADYIAALIDLRSFSTRK